MLMTPRACVASAVYPANPALL